MLTALQCSACQPQAKEAPALECALFPVRQKVFKQMLLQKKNEAAWLARPRSCSPHIPPGRRGTPGKGNSVKSGVLTPGDPLLPHTGGAQQDHAASLCLHAPSLFPIAVGSEG